MCGTLNTSRNRIGPRILPFSARLVPIPQRIQKSGMMESLTYGASIIGLMVVGAMTASMIDIPST
jgi:hypothetical protein